MEADQKPIALRRTRLSSLLTASSGPLGQDTLLDALQALYDECSPEFIKKRDPLVARFVEKYKRHVQEVRRLRPNAVDFEVKALIGKGRFGDVHLVKERQTGHLYAMKCVRKADTESPSFEIEKEIMILTSEAKKLKNVDWLTDLKYSFQDQTTLFFVMEYHPGGDLWNLIRREGGVLPESAAVFYISELVLALGELHKMRFIHRDIKPENVLLDRCGHLKLADFGSATRIDETGMVVDGDMPVGTPNYVAPEVLKSLEGKEKGQYGVPCDYWSVGIMAYEMAVGRTPLEAPTTAATYAKIMSFSTATPPSVKFPAEILLTQAFVSFVRNLVCDQKKRLKPSRIREHPLFANVDFDSLKHQVPPYVPRLDSPEDVSNFSNNNESNSQNGKDSKREPNMNSFRRKVEFSGRNLPFIGFTYGPHVDPMSTSGSDCRSSNSVVEKLRSELEDLRSVSVKCNDLEAINLSLERKLEEKSRRLDNCDSLRDKLEKDLAAKMAETVALKRTLELERKDRADLEKKALDLIKSAKTKWETSERAKIEQLNRQFDCQQLRIDQLEADNRSLSQQLSLIKESDKINRENENRRQSLEKLSRKSVMGLENQLERVSMESRDHVEKMRAVLNEQSRQNQDMQSELKKCRKSEENLKRQLDAAEACNRQLEQTVEALRQQERELRKQLKVEETGGVLKQMCDKLVDMSSAHKRRSLPRPQSEPVSEDKKQESKTIGSLIVATSRRLSLIGDHLTEQADRARGTADMCRSMSDVCESMSEIADKLTDLAEGVSTSEDMCEIDRKLCQLMDNVEAGRNKLGDDGTKAAHDLAKAWTELGKVAPLLEGLAQSVRSTKAQAKKVATADEDEVKQLRLKLWKTEKELSNSQLDKRILERESKDTHKELRMLQDKVAAAEDKVRKREEALAELSRINENLSMDLLKSRQLVGGYESQIELDKSKMDDQRILIAEMGELVRDKSERVDELRGVEEENRVMRGELEGLRVEARNFKANWEALKEACTLLEIQVLEYEKLNLALNKDKKCLHDQIQVLNADLVKLQAELVGVEKSLNSEQNTRQSAQGEVQRLVEEKRLLVDEVGALQDRIGELRLQSNDLDEQLTVSEEKNAELQVNVRSLERQIRDFVQENMSLKEEISRYLTQMSHLKQENYDIRKELKDSKGGEALLREEIGRLEAMIHMFGDKEIKYESTIQQQTKLINYLHIKIDEHSQKKKTLADKLFGSSSKKENLPPPFLQTNLMELEQQLAKQRRINKELRDELQKSKTQTSEPPKTEVQNNATAIVEGWVKLLILRNKSESKAPKVWEWEKRYARLLPDSFNIYSTADIEHARLLDSVQVSSGRVVLEPLPSEIGVNVADRDLPFVIKVEVGESVVVFMALSVEERDSWYRALQQIFNSTAEPEETNADPSGNYDITTILTLPTKEDNNGDRIRINSVVQLTRHSRGLFILATNKGLCLCHHGNQSTLRRVDDLNDELVAVCAMETIDAVVMATAQGGLICCALSHLLNLAECDVMLDLNYRAIESGAEDKFHKLVKSGGDILAAANSKKLVIFKFRATRGEFELLKVMDTARPIACGLFTPHNTLIVGADKYFEIDLSGNRFKVEEFLDRSDVFVKQIAKCCEKTGAHPVAIMQMRHDPIVFCVCFSNSLTIFVDEFGRSFVDRNRKEIEWPSAPTDFCLVDSMIVGVGHQGVDMVGVDEDERVLVPLKGARFVGWGKDGVLVCHKGKLKAVRNRLRALESECNSDSGDDAFSFSSSIVRDLDECENQRDGDKRVTFCPQTDI